jgi:CIC family chloride channel protein
MNDEKQSVTVEMQQAAIATFGLSPLSPPPAQFRVVMISFLAAAIGLIAGLVAYALYKLIALFTNLFFFHQWSTNFTSVRYHHLGAWVILIPVIGGLIVGVMAKYGTPKIKGHGIPEAMEAVLVNRSRIEPRVALLKPI